MARTAPRHITPVPDPRDPGPSESQDMASFVRSLRREIWQDRNLAALRSYGAPDVIVRSPGGVCTGREALLARAYRILGEAQGRELFCEDLIGCATPLGESAPAGFHSAERLAWVPQAPPLPWGVGGTGGATPLRMMEDIWWSAQQMRDIWVIRDHGALLRQSEQDPKSQIAAQIAAEGGPERCRLPLTPDTDIEGPYLGSGDDSAEGQRLADMLKTLMGGRFSSVPQIYDPACALAYPGGITALGPKAATQFWAGLRSAFPAAIFAVEHRGGQARPGAAPSAALRWSLYGKHDGPGMFGPPSGLYVYVMGMTHGEFGPDGLRREWTLFDEAAIWRQILLAGG